MLEGFKIYNLPVGLATMSVTRNGVGFNKTSVMKLDFADHVLVMINAPEKQIAIQTCTHAQEGETPFYKGERNAKVVSVRWNNKDLIKTISKMMSWDLKKTGYRIEGEHIEEENALIFDLTKATEIS